MITARLYWRKDGAGDPQWATGDPGEAWAGSGATIQAYSGNCDVQVHASVHVCTTDTHHRECPTEEQK